MALIKYKDCGAEINSQAGHIYIGCGSVMGLMFIIVLVIGAFSFSSCGPSAEKSVGRNGAGPMYEPTPTEGPMGQLTADRLDEPTDQDGNIVLVKCADEGTTYDKAKCKETYVGRVYNFNGTVFDVKDATTLTIRINSGNFANVSFKSNIGDIVRKDQFVNFRGQLDRVGTGIVIDHEISDAYLMPSSSSDAIHAEQITVEQAASELESQLLCHSAPKPGKIIRAMLQSGLLKETDRFDGAPVLIPTTKIFVFGHRVTFVSGWQMDGDNVIPPFFRGPGTAPPRHISISFDIPPSELAYQERRTVGADGFVSGPHSAVYAESLDLSEIGSTITCYE